MRRRGDLTEPLQIRVDDDRRTVRCCRIAGSLRECTTYRRLTEGEALVADGQLYGRSTCSALVITCSDFRFKSIERSFLEAAGLTDDYDLIARPGAARALVAPRDTAARETMLDEIQLLRDLHRFDRVLLINHMSCRAYDDLATGEAQRAVHEAHLRAAATGLERQFDGLAAETYLIDLVDGALRVDPLPATKRDRWSAHH